MESRAKQVEVDVEIFSAGSGSQEAITATIVFKAGEPVGIENLLVHGEFVSGNGASLSVEALSDYAVKMLYKKAAAQYARELAS